MNDSLKKLALGTCTLAVLFLLTACAIDSGRQPKGSGGISYSDSHRQVTKNVWGSGTIGTLSRRLSERELVTKKPRINGTVFGSITIGGIVFKHDVVITANGTVERRRFSGHTISLREVKQLLATGKNAHLLIVGSGQSGQVKLSPVAAAYAKQRKLRVVVLPTPKAIKAWNSAKVNPIGLFHVNC